MLENSKRYESLKDLESKVVGKLDQIKANVLVDLKKEDLPCVSVTEYENILIYKLKEGMTCFRMAVGQKENPDADHRFCLFFFYTNRLFECAFIVLEGLFFCPFGRCFQAGRPASLDRPTGWVQKLFRPVFGRPKYHPVSSYQSYASNSKQSIHSKMPPKQIFQESSTCCSEDDRLLLLRARAVVLCGC